MNLLITGATGFVGRNLIPILEKEEKIKKILLLVRNKNKLKKINSKKIQICSISEDFNAYLKKFSPDKVIHLASFLTSKNDTESISKILEANISFGTYLLDALKECNIKEFINFGSFAEYRLGKELNSAYLYTATKTAFRSIIKYYADLLEFKYYNIVPYTIYGGEDTQKKVIDYIKDSFEKEIDMSPGEQILDFIHIDDVCDFIKTLILNNKEIPNGIDFFLGTGKGTSIRELSILIENIYKKKTNINWGQLSYRERDVMHAVASIGNNIEYLNWKSKISLEEGFYKIMSLEEQQ